MHQISFICDVQSSIKMFGGGESSNTTQKSDPWSGQQSYLSDIFSQAKLQNDTYNPQYYPDSTVADMNNVQTGAIDQTANLGSQGSSAINAANGALTNYADGSMLSAGNPYFQNVADQTAASVTPQLLSSLTQGSTDNPNVALAASNGIANAVGNLAYQNYNTQSGNQLTAAQAAPNVYASQLSGLNAAYGAGTDLQTQAQNQLTDQVNRFNYYQQLPYEKLNQYSNLVNGQYGSTITSSSPSQSALSSIFSDMRMKENIKQVGNLDNGMPVYLFTYKGDSRRQFHIGLMAQDVEKTCPEAVHTNANGIKMVNYEKAILGGDHGTQ